ncbi:catalase family protein [Tsukamurella sp. 8F]|nr:MULTISPECIES: catalase family protein [unclassified Tsukamurella]MDF0528801.1 catalase family protein [Tsukamurella sp. 8J]MDF0586636.1 catalase family protein [Tsukamurella sp. 8F]
MHEQRTYIEYRADLEQIPPDEAATIEKMVRSLRSDSEYATKKFHRGLRDAHAKAHALLRGDLVIEPDLPEELAQGLFARPGIYPVVARLSTTSGAIRHDRIRGIRGFAVKVLGVEGERCRADGADTHDMLFVSHAGFPFADAKSYSFGGMLSAWLLARLPDGVLYPIELLLSGLRQCHVRLGPALDLVSHPNTHILGLSFFTAAPLRYGRYVARLRVVPSSPEVRALVGKPPIARGHDAFADDVQAFYARSAAEYEVQAQLCTDLAAMPIEDVRHEWPEDLSPFRTVARLSFPQQDPHTPERLEFGENLSFTPFTGLAAHRPLGSINRLKLRVYDSSSGYRHSVNGVARIEPSINELPQ